MSWPTWPGTAAGAMAAHQSGLLPTPVNPAPPVGAPPGGAAAVNPLQYSQEQWAQAQQQNWQQWAQWQQQYQQWHQQYGAEYQKSLTAMQTVAAVQPPLPVGMPGMGVAPQPPLPTENPPLPPDDAPKPQPPGGYTTAPPPIVAQDPYGVLAQQQQQYGVGQYGMAQQQPQQQQRLMQQQQAQKRPYDQPPDAYQDPSKRPYDGAGANRPGQQWPAGGAAKPPLANQKQPGAGAPQATSTPTRDAPAAPKPNIEELSEAEKKFDKEFAAWEAQFNKWKEQNANHPDKAQYREYEKKWESWRNSLLERREQMRRKRLALAEAANAGAAPHPPANKPAAPVQGAPPIGGGRQPPFAGGRQPPPGNQPRFGGAGDGPPPQSPYGKPPPNVLPPAAYNNEPLDSFKGQPPPQQPNESIIGGGGGDFLKKADTSGGIPGLDLVKDGEDEEESKDHSQNGEVIELDKDDPKYQQQREDGAAGRTAQGPDFAAISKGINTILGDQKLLNMLSKVSQNQPSGGGQPVLTDTVAGGFSGGTVAGVGGVKPDYSAPPPSFQNFRSAPPPAPGNDAYSVPPPAFGGGGPGFNDRRKEGEYFGQAEAVNNFDDQTQSSFHDDAFRTNRERLSGPPPGGKAGPPSLMDLGGGKMTMPSQNDRFGAPPPDDRFGRPPPNDRFGGPPPNDRFGGPPPNDRFGGPPPNDRFGGPPPNDRFGGPPPNDRFGQRPNDRFEGRPFDNKFKDGGDIGGRGNFGGNKGNNFGRKSNSFEEDNKNWKNNANYEDYDEYNEDDDYEKYHEMFSEDDRKEDMPPRGGRFGPQDDRGGRFGPQDDRGGRFGAQDDRGGRFGPQDERGGGGRFGPQDGRGGRFGPQDERGGGGGRFGPQDGRGGRFGPQDERGGRFGPQDERGGRFGPQDERGGRFPPQDERGGRFPPQDERGGRFGPRDERGGRFDEEEDFGQPGDQGPPGGPPPLMKLTPMDLPPPVNEEPPPPPEPEKPQLEFEIIEYDHKSKKTGAELEVIVEPTYMFDYRHKPVNRIPYPQRPSWLAEAVKFIREFDPLAPKKMIFDRVPVGRYEWNPNDDLKDRNDRRDDRMEPRDRFGRGNRYENNNRRHIESYDAVGGRRGDRQNRRSGSIERNRYERDRYDDRNDRNDRNDRYDRNDRNRPERQRRDSRRSADRPALKKEDLEELSDDAMDDWERDDMERSGNRRSASPSMVMSNPPNPEPVTPQETMIEDILNPPGRFKRPPRIVIILRGPPGSGKTYLARLIKDKEVEQGGSAPRILSLDDYFMVEQEKQVKEDGKTQMVKEMVYEYEAEMEESYRTSLMKSFKKTVTDGYFPFIIVDNINDKVKHFGEMWSFAKQSGFQVYICQLDLDPVLCTKRNTHNRSEKEIEDIISGWEPTPAHHPTVDASGLLNAASAIQEVEMEVVEDQQEAGTKDGGDEGKEDGAQEGDGDKGQAGTDDQEDQQQEDGPEDHVGSKWDNFDCSLNNLAKLDGVSKPIKRSGTMEEYLRMEDEWQPPPVSSVPGKKRVRWADLEEQREQAKMRAIGFVVGQTDWTRMMDPTMGGSALTRTKYIERSNRRF